MYSQNDEETVILKYVEGISCRRFLDIGAHDGVTFSNTRRLAELGWGGTLVEPSPVPFAGLEKNYVGRSDVNLVRAAVVPDGLPRTVRFHDSGGDCVSTLDDKHRALWTRGGAKFQTIEVEALPVDALLEHYPGPYSVLSLDVEGTNFALFCVLSPMDELGIEVACVEYQDKLNQIVGIAAAQGYVQVHVTSENVILVRR